MVVMGVVYEGWGGTGRSLYSTICMAYHFGLFFVLSSCHLGSYGRGGNVLLGQVCLVGLRDLFIIHYFRLASSGVLLSFVLVHTYLYSCSPRVIRTSLLLYCLIVYCVSLLFYPLWLEGVIIDLEG